MAHFTPPDQAKQGRLVRESLQPNAIELTRPIDLRPRLEKPELLALSGSRLLANRVLRELLALAREEGNA